MIRRTKTVAHTGATVRRTLLTDLVRVCRPHQWAKNCFVLAPLVFSGSLARPGAWLPAGVAFLTFCLLSSAVYCLNDVLDAPIDRRHPRKQERPVASGRVRPSVVVTLALALIGTAVGLASWCTPAGFIALGGLYLLNSLVYCVLLKHRVIIDVLAIAVGFVLRLLAGCAAISVEPSSWILVCGFSLALLLGFGKRRLEVGALQQPTEYRPVLESYSPEKLNLLLGITSSMCLLSYMLYTVSPETARIHHSDKLFYSVPFVAYGIFRYLFKVQEGRHDGPVEVLLSDPIFAVNGLLWIISVVGVLYLSSSPIPESP